MNQINFQHSYIFEKKANKMFHLNSFTFKKEKLTKGMLLNQKKNTSIKFKYQRLNYLRHQFRVIVFSLYLNSTIQNKLNFIFSHKFA